MIIAYFTKKISSPILWFFWFFSDWELLILEPNIYCFIKKISISFKKKFKKLIFFVFFYLCFIIWSIIREHNFEWTRRRKKNKKYVLSVFQKKNDNFSLDSPFSSFILDLHKIYRICGFEREREIFFIFFIAAWNGMGWSGLFFVYSYEYNQVRKLIVIIHC